MPRIKQTISVSRGKTAIEHDLREYTPGNVDASMTQYNKVLINELRGKTLAEYTNEYMKNYIDEYNKKQRRNDRKKSYDYAGDYIKEQNHMQTSRQNYKAGQLAYEYVIQYGDHESMNVNKVIADKCVYEDVVAMYQEFLDVYQATYPHMRIILATLHMDEPKGTPHMHILVQPIGEGYKQGLSHQISLTKALACDGFERADARKERLSLTRWQDDIKDNIMEPILTKHEYVRVYKDGEKHHMPVALYKKTMEKKEEIIHGARSMASIILRNADEKAQRQTKDISEKVMLATEELQNIKEEKDILINGIAQKNDSDAPYTDWSLDELKEERRFYVEGTPGEKDIDNMSIPQLKKEYGKWGKKYKMLIEGYDKPDGTHIWGYNELLSKYKELIYEPQRLLDTDVGRKVLEDAKEEIAESVYKKMMTDIMGFVENHIFNAIKRHLVEPLHKGIDEMMLGHYFKMNDNDERILEKAINESVDSVTDELQVGKNVAAKIRENIPEKLDIENEVDRKIRKFRAR